MLVLPGFLFPSRQYEGLVADLRRKGHPAGKPWRRAAADDSPGCGLVGAFCLPRSSSSAQLICLPPPNTCLAEVVNTAYADWLPSIGGGSFEWFLARADAALLDMHARWVGCP